MYRVVLRGREKTFVSEVGAVMPKDGLLTFEVENGEAYRDFAELVSITNLDEPEVTPEPEVVDEPEVTKSLSDLTKKELAKIAMDAGKSEDELKYMSKAQLIEAIEGNS